MSWLVDNAATVYVLLGMVAGGFAMAWWLTKRVKFLAVAGGIVALMALFWLLTRLVVTDRRQIETNVREMADAAAAGRVEDLVRHLAADVTVQRRDFKRKEVADAVRRVLNVSPIKYVHIFDFEVTELTRQGNQGHAAVNFKARVDGRGDEVLALPWCVTDFVIEDGRWKLRRVEFRNSIANTDQLMPIPGF
jgi:hypothetical protein